MIKSSSKQELGNTQILIPTLVLAELTLIAQKQRVAIAVPAVLEAIQQSSGTIVDFDFPVFQAFLELPEAWDLHDRIISATAKHYGARLITRDAVLRASDVLETVWD